MMKIINVSKCLTSQGNTGIPECFKDIGYIKGVIFAPKNSYYTPAQGTDVPTLVAAMQMDTLATASERIYPLINFIGVENNSEDDVIETSGFGYESTVRDGQYKMTHRFYDGAMCLNSELHKLFKYKKMDVYYIDNKDQLIGWKDEDGNLRPFTTGNIDPKKMVPGDGSNPAMYHIAISLPRPEQLNEQFAIIQLTQAPETIFKGLLNVNLTVSNVTGTGLTVTAKVGCSQTDMYDAFADELEEVTAFALKDSAGAVVTITGVAKNATAKGWDITATLSGTMTINLGAPLTLSALGVGVPPANGYEGKPTTFVVSS